VGFLDKAKAAASDLAAKADTALSNSGMGGGPDPATLYRDLGRMTYDEHAGRPVDPEAKARILAELAALEQQGRLAAAPPTPPPPPGTAPAAPPPPQSAADVPPPAPQEASPQPDPAEGHAPPPPPPPPEWPKNG
jgi:hypothetical protein